MSGPNLPLSATAGAIPYINEKGQMSMKTVHVNRYVAGKVPEYGKTKLDDDSDSNEMIDNEEDDNLKEFFPNKPILAKKADEVEEDTESSDDNYDDKRLQRLNKYRKEPLKYELMDDSDSEGENRIARHIRERQAERQLDTAVDGDRSDDNDDAEQVKEEDDEEVARRRALAKERALAYERENPSEFLPIVDTVNEEIANDVDFVEYSDEEDSGADSDVEREPKMKPVFVAAHLRRTINKTAEEVAKDRENELKQQMLKKELKESRKRLIEDMKKEEVAEKNQILNDVDTEDDEDENHSFNLWQIREVKRLKRAFDLDEIERQKEETARIRNMTEEQRAEEFKKNPKKIINAKEKGNMRFMQKYYHRGAFFVQDLEDKVFQRDFTSPTLEDNFDKTTMLKILQVKNFGKASRTKYTHLVDQDTTDFDSGWSKDGIQKFYSNRGGGMKQIFEAPTKRK